jgi:hypothetical protein
MSRPHPSRREMHQLWPDSEPEINLGPQQGVITLLEASKVQVRPQDKWRYVGASKW